MIVVKDIDLTSLLVSRYVVYNPEKMLIENKLKSSKFYQLIRQGDHIAFGLIEGLSNIVIR
jgi:hypothetical protein